MTTKLAPLATAPRLLAGLRPGAMSRADHLALHGPLPDRPDLIARLDASGLRGMGGASFPTATKWRAVEGRRGPKTVVVNATEGEPASRKDKVLSARAPHLVMDGAISAARAVGARRVIVAISEDSGRLEDVLLNALSERTERDIRVEVSVIPPGFIAGEETALVSAINGGARVPTFRGPRPDQRGVDGRATLVQNAETLGHVALIARHGPAWFRRAGTDAEPGTALVSVSGAVNQRAVMEVELGTPLREILDRAGGTDGPLRALIVGGYHGGVIGAEMIDEVVLTDASLRAAGAALGARAIVAIPQDACGLAEAAAIISYLAGETAGQCGPCVFGLAAIANGMDRLHGGDPRVVPQIESWLDQVRGRGACRHPDGTAGFVASALRVFGPEIEHHATHRCHATRVLERPWTS
jgi:NADH:ubiquinone oxidoreductase subunit F (NADH-binding)